MYIVGEEAATEQHALHDRLFHDPDPAGRSPHVFSLALQGIDYPSTNQCPALAEDGRCSIHTDLKPAMCSVVPLDPCAGDRLQSVVLLKRRHDAGYLGADCISLTTVAPFRPLVKHGRIADAAFNADLERKRGSLAADKQRWGNAVFDILKKDLLATPARERIPESGYVSLPLVPVLAVLANESNAMRQRCIAFIDAQLALIESAMSLALQRKRQEDRPFTAQLRAFSQAYAKQRALLEKGAPR
jgi:hypothetical protein